MEELMRNEKLDVYFKVSPLVKAKKITADIIRRYNISEDYLNCYLISNGNGLFVLTADFFENKYAPYH